MAVLLSVAAGTDLYALLGVTFFIPFLGTVLTGIMFSRGANYLSDFIKLTQAYTHTKNIEGTSIETETYCGENALDSREEDTQ